jgi:2-aminoadipate transaminase
VIDDLPRPTISFARGVPSADLVDADGLAAAARRALNRDPGGALLDLAPAGYGPLRRWIAAQHEVDPAQVLVTNGSMQAARLLFEATVGPGDAAVVEGPTYDRALSALRATGADVHQVGLQHDGIDLDQLDALLDGTSAPSRLVGVIPNFQNPTGVSLSVPKRRALAALAHRHDMMVFEDDPYRALAFGEGEPPLTIRSFAPDRVVYASSFSKTVCPGARVGYLIGPPSLIRRLERRAADIYIAPSVLAQAIVHEFVSGDRFEAALAHARRTLAVRARCMLDGLAEAMPGGRCAAPSGGYFLWLTLPDELDGDVFFQAASKLGVSLVRGSGFLLDGGAQAFRLCFASVTTSQIHDGVSRLAVAAAATATAVVT